MNNKARMGIQLIGNQFKKNNNTVQSKNTTISYRSSKLNNTIPMLSKNIQSRPPHTPSTSTSTKQTPYVTAIVVTETATDKQHDFVDPNENDNAETQCTNTDKIYNINPSQINIQYNTNTINIPNKTISFATIMANEKNPSREQAFVLSLSTAYVK